MTSPQDPTRRPSRVAAIGGEYDSPQTYTISKHQIHALLLLHEYKSIVLSKSVKNRM